MEITTKEDLVNIIKSQDEKIETLSNELNTLKGGGEKEGKKDNDDVNTKDEKDKKDETTKRTDNEIDEIHELLNAN